MMAKLERTYNVPLRRGFKKAVRYKKAKKAVKTLQEFLARHMKVDIKNVKIGPIVNEKIWERGIRKPPHHVKVTAIKEDDIVKAELFGFKYEEVKIGGTEDEKKDKKAEEKDVKALEKELDEVIEKKPVKKKSAKKKVTKKAPAKKPATKKAKPKPKKTPSKKKPVKKVKKK